MSRPNKQTVLEYLALNGQVVDVTIPVTHTLYDSADNANVLYETIEAMYKTSPELHGWTQAELDDPTITE